MRLTLIFKQIIIDKCNNLINNHDLMLTEQLNKIGETLL